jgi:hypothetical protein
LQILSLLSTSVFNNHLPNHQFRRYHLKMGSYLLPNIFLNSPWPGVIVWCGLFISDYALTLWCARLRAAGARDKFATEGSYEITPLYQRDIDSQRLISPRFLMTMVLNVAFLTGVFYLTSPGLYYFMLGMSVCLQLAIHVRHLRNLVLFRAALSDEVRGRIEYARPVMLRMSAVEMLTFSGLFLLLFVFTQNWFTAGGAFGCSVTALKHWRLAQKGGSRAQAQGA